MNNACNLCPRQCNVNRDLKYGFCHALNTMKICRIAPHFYEEPPISGTNGSGTIFFSGCSLDCEFCQNYNISKSYTGKEYTPEQLAEEIFKLEKTGVHNINFVTPTHFSHKIKATLDIYRPAIPIVYNTSGYELGSIIEGLLPYVDIFLVDIKYSSNNYARKYSKCNNYVENCYKATEIMVKNKPIIFDSEIMKQGVIIRHLVLPNNLDNTFGVIRHYSQNYIDSAYLSVMSQFVPEYKSSIKRGLTPLEYKIVLKRIIDEGIDNCFIQELTSASSEYIPKFYTGD